MIKLETFKKQAKLLFNEIKDVDLLNSYHNLSLCKNTIAKSLGFKNLQDAIYDTYEKEGLTSFHKKNDNTLKHDFSSHKKPSFIDFQISYDSHEYQEQFNSKASFIVDDKNTSKYFKYFEEINFFSCKNNIFVQNIDKFPHSLVIKDNNKEKSIYFEINRNSNFISNPYTIDPLNITLASQDFCNKFFHPLISQWLHPFMVSIYQKDLIIDIFSFIDLFNLPYLISQKNHYSEIKKYLDKLGINDPYNITKEQLQEHSSLCSTPVALNDLFKAYSRIFSNINQKGCFQFFSNHVCNEKLGSIKNKIFKICLNSDPLDNLAGQLLLSAVTTYEYDIQLNKNKKEHNLISSKNSYNNSIENSNIYLIGANKSNTLISNENNKNKFSLNFIFKTEDFISLKKWQKEIILENSRDIIVLNKSENLMPYIPISIKRAMLNSEKIPDSLRTEFKGLYILSSTIYYSKTINFRVKKIS